MQETKLKRFMADEEMQEAVYEVLLDSFLEKGGEQGTEDKAAAFIAISKLRSAWKQLDRYRPVDINKKGVERNVGM